MIEAVTDDVKLNKVDTFIKAIMLATLRLFRKMPNMRQGYSTNLQKFYFSVELL